MFHLASSWLSYSLSFFISSIFKSSASFLASTFSFGWKDFHLFCHCCFHFSCISGFCERAVNKKGDQIRLLTASTRIPGARSSKNGGFKTVSKPFQKYRYEICLRDDLKWRINSERLWLVNAEVWPGFSPFNDPLGKPENIAITWTMVPCIFQTAILWGLAGVEEILDIFPLFLHCFIFLPLKSSIRWENYIQFFLIVCSNSTALHTFFLYLAKNHN